MKGDRQRIKNPDDGYRELAYVIVRDTLQDYRNTDDEFKRKAILHFMESSLFETLCWGCGIDPEFLVNQIKRLKKTS